MFSLLRSSEGHGISFHSSQDKFCASKAAANSNRYVGGPGEEVDSSVLSVSDHISTYTWEGRNRKYIVFPYYSPKEEVLGSVNTTGFRQGARQSRWRYGFHCCKFQHHLWPPLACVILGKPCPLPCFGFLLGISGMVGKKILSRGIH